LADAESAYKAAVGLDLSCDEDHWSLQAIESMVEQHMEMLVSLAAHDHTSRAQRYGDVRSADHQVVGCDDALSQAKVFRQRLHDSLRQHVYAELRLVLPSVELDKQVSDVTHVSYNNARGALPHTDFALEENVRGGSHLLPRAEATVADLLLIILTGFLGGIFA
jgi:hypothetical protein